MLITRLKIAAMILFAGSIVAGSSAVLLRQVFAAAPLDNQAADTADAKKSVASNDPGAKDNPDPQWNDLTDEQKDDVSLRHLKAVMYAVHSYADNNELKLPPAAVPNPDLPPNKRLSGFVLLLPYLGVRPSYVAENDETWQEWHADNDAARMLFDTIDLKKAWDDPVNAKAAKTIVQEFLVPSGAPLRSKGGYAASHFAFVRGGDGKDNGAFPLQGKTELAIRDISDGTSSTLAVGQIHDEVGPWIAAGPSTARFAGDQIPGFGSQYPGCAYFANVDAFVYFFDLANTERRILHFLARRDDGGTGIVNADDYLRYASASEWKKSKGNK